MTDLLAGRWRRLFAWFIDATLVPGLAFILVMITGVVEDAEDYTSNWWMLQVLLIAIVSYLVLNGYLLAKHGQTIGKKLLGISVRTRSGEIPPLWKLILVRAWFFPIPYLLVVWPVTILVLVNFLLVFTASRRCGHDYVAQTQVMREQEPS